jgi:hypothetical protein
VKVCVSVDLRGVLGVTVYQMSLALAELDGLPHLPLAELLSAN